MSEEERYWADLRKPYIGADGRSYTVDDDITCVALGVFVAVAARPSGKLSHAATHAPQTPVSRCSTTGVPTSLRRLIFRTF
jgi:hypothetical protein